MNCQSEALTVRYDYTSIESSIQKKKISTQSNEDYRHKDRTILRSKKQVLQVINHDNFYCFYQVTAYQTAKGRQKLASQSFFTLYKTANSGF